MTELLRNTNNSTDDQQNKGLPEIATNASLNHIALLVPALKKEIGKQLDQIIESVVPYPRKAVKWNTPFYGAPKMKGWFIAFYTYSKYVQVTFFQGTSLRPVPPGESKVKNVRYLKIFEDGFDEEQLAKWVKQAAALPGEEI